MKERMESLQKTLIEQGMSQERLVFTYVSAAEGLIFANMMKRMDKEMKELGAAKIREENNKLMPYIEKVLGKKGLIPKK